MAWFNMEHFNYEFDQRMFHAVSRSCDIKLVVRLRKSTFPIFQAIMFCNMAFGQNKKGQNRPRLHIRKFKYTMGSYKTKITVYNNINIAYPNIFMNTFFISCLFPYLCHKKYKRRRYIRFYPSNNNISISSKPSKYGDAIFSQLMLIYKHSSLSPIFTKTTHDLRKRFRDVATAYA